MQAAADRKGNADANQEQSGNWENSRRQAQQANQNEDKTKRRQDKDASPPRARGTTSDEPGDNNNCSQSRQPDEAREERIGHGVSDHFDFTARSREGIDATPRWQSYVKAGETTGESQRTPCLLIFNAPPVLSEYSAYGARACAIWAGRIKSAASVAWPRLT